MKAQIPLKFLVRLLVALMIFIPVIIFGCELFRVSSQATSSFVQLSELIEELATKPTREEARSMPLYIDRGTFIAGFTAKSDGISVVRKKLREVDLIYDIGIIPFVPKPDKCKENSSCICLCIGCDTTYPDTDDFRRFREVVWKDYTCISFDNLNFPTKTSLAKFEQTDDARNKDFIGGFIIDRTQLFYGIENPRPRLRTIYVEKYGDLIAICENQPCYDETEAS